MLRVRSWLIYYVYKGPHQRTSTRMCVWVRGLGLFKNLFLKLKPNKVTSSSVLMVMSHRESILLLTRWRTKILRDELKISHFDSLVHHSFVQS